MSSPAFVDLPGDLLEAEVVACLYFRDQKPPVGPAALLDWRLDEVLSRALAAGELEGGEKEQFMVAAGGKVRASWVLFHGGGNACGLTVPGLSALAKVLARTCLDAGFTRIALSLPSIGGQGPEGTQRILKDLCGNLVAEGKSCLISVERLG